MNEKLDKYEFERSEKDGFFLCKVFNNKALKEWKRQIYNYRFKTEQSREAWITNFKKNVQSRLDYKAERKAERFNFVNPAKVGDILYASWGYDQTNIDFYEVTAVKGKQIIIQEVAQTREQTEWMQGNCLPVPGKYIIDSKPLKKMVRPDNKDSYQVTIASYANAWLWDGKSKGYTQYA